jgi:hypothetical protein
LYINLDVAMEEEDGLCKIAKSRVKRVIDWKLHHSTWTAAFVALKLRPNDMKFIGSMGISLISFVLITLSLTAQLDGMIGFVMAIPMLYLGVCFMIASSVIYQARPFVLKEIIYWTVVNVAFEVVGILFFIYEFEVSEFKIDVNERNES